MGSSASAPQEPSISDQFNELSGAVQNSLQTNEQSDKMGDPTFSSLISQVMQNSGNSYAQNYNNDILPESQTAASSLQSGSVQALNQNGSNMTQAYMNANPALSPTLSADQTAANGGLGQGTMQAQGAATMAEGNTIAGLGMNYAGRGSTPLLQQMNQQAQSELATGGQLSGNEMNSIAQNTMGSFNASGLGNSSAAFSDAALNTQQAVNTRLQQYQANASNVQGLNTTQEATNAGAASSMFQDASGMYNSGTSLYNGAGMLQNTANQNLFGTASLMDNPLSTMQGSYLNAVNTLGTQFQGAGMSTPMVSMQNPSSNQQYASNYFDTQENANASANVENAQAGNSLLGAGISAGTSLASSATSAYFLSGALSAAAAAAAA
jgi:hypothetical protein